MTPGLPPSAGLLASVHPTSAPSRQKPVAERAVSSRSQWRGRSGISPDSRHRRELR